MFFLLKEFLEPLEVDRGLVAGSAGVWSEGIVSVF